MTYVHITFAFNHWYWSADGIDWYSSQERFALDERTLPYYLNQEN